MKKYNPQKIEKKWQRLWEKQGDYIADTTKDDNKNFMLLVEFPYPSGNLHIGHWYTYSLTDALARYLRMNGKKVFYPIGFDAFGLPAENAAIKNSIHPKKWTEKNIKHMTKQLKSMGATFDWTKTVSTMDPNYYKWTQWLFIQFFKKNLAYKTKIPANWCPNDKTVLANEQVIDGHCDRCGTKVEQKEIEQWLFRTTAYVNELYNDIDNLDWPETIKIAQKNWIGKSEGSAIKFKVKNNNESIEIFTTRADTLFGATYLILAPENKLVEKITTEEQKETVKSYINRSKNKTEFERTNLEKEKTGVFTGGYIIHPLTNEIIPIWISDYVIGHYGTGAVMAVPAHDQRDFEFAKKYVLPLKKVIVPQLLNDIKTDQKIESDCYIDDGNLINSSEFSGLSSKEARQKITQSLKEKNLGDFKTNFRLHDWTISRQRYWGVPIPIINCSKCGGVPVPEKELPIKLPPLKDYQPSDSGRSPLAKATSWLKTKCPNCDSPAERETDTMDTFVDSSWYFFRYTDPNNDKEFASKKNLKKWLPVPLYIGGSEHNTMHLLYSRFFTKAMFDLELIEFNEPFLRRVNRGIILGPDGQKMSKSRGNVIDPDLQVEAYGSDTVRMYLAFMGPYESGGLWDAKGINGVCRFINRIWNFANKTKWEDTKIKSHKLEVLVEKTIKKVGEDIKELKFNTAVSALMILLNNAEKENENANEFLKKFLLILSPLAPHLTEEIWSNVLKNKQSIHLQAWPSFNATLIESEPVSIVVQINGKIRGLLQTEKNTSEKSILNRVLKDSRFDKYIQNSKIKKTVFIPDKLINLII